MDRLGLNRWYCPAFAGTPLQMPGGPVGELRGRRRTSRVLSGLLGAEWDLYVVHRCVSGRRRGNGCKPFPLKTHSVVVTA